MSPEAPELAAALPLALDLPASAAGVGEGQPRLSRFLEDHAVPARDIARAELIFEEVLMNVAMHAFDDPAGQTVRVTATVAPGAVALTFEDRGRAFNPVAATPRSAPGDFDEERPGGFGLVLLKQTASSLGYDRLPEGINRLRVGLCTGRDAGG